MDIEINKQDPVEWLKQLNDIKEFVFNSKNEFNSIYRYCWGCNKYVKLSDGYEGRATLDTEEFLTITTPAIRCKDCGKVLKFIA